MKGGGAWRENTCMYTHTHAYITCMQIPMKSKREQQISPKLEIKEVASYPLGVLGTELRSSERTACAFNIWELYTLLNLQSEFLKLFT